MRKWTALYYPTIEPPLPWLRSAALLFENVTSLVPKESEERLSKDIRQFAESTDAWHPYRPDETAKTLVGQSLERLGSGFAAIAAQRKSRPIASEIQIEI